MASAVRKSFPDHHSKVDSACLHAFGARVNIHEYQAKEIFRKYGVPIPPGEGGLAKHSVVLCSQIRTVDELKFGKIYGRLSAATMKQIDAALRISLQL